MSATKQTDGWKDMWKKKCKDKNTWLLVGLVGLLLLVIALPGKSPAEHKADARSEDSIGKDKGIGVREACDENEDSASAESDVTGLEQRLEDTLSLIDGAGKVRVMLTLKDCGEKVVEKDTARRTDGQRQDAGTDTSENTVYMKNGSEEAPYISNRLAPQVEGVLVVAQGGGNSIVKQNILQSVMALFPLEAHKITIVKMSMQEVSEHENF